MLINVKMPTIVGILTFMNRIKVYSAELSIEKVFITSGPGQSKMSLIHVCLLKLQKLLFTKVYLDGLITTRRQRPLLVCIKMCPRSPKIASLTVKMMILERKYSDRSQMCKPLFLSIGNAVLFKKMRSGFAYPVSRFVTFIF